MSFVAIPAASFDSVFSAAGFTKATVNREVVYDRAHRDPRFIIRVYTSLTEGATECRNKGADAIRACLLLKTGERYFGLTKTTRVNRTGAPAEVIERALSRAREMWTVATGFAASKKCPKCSGPTYGDSGRCATRC